MNEDQLDSLFENAPQMPPALADQIRARIQQDTQPAKPLMSVGALIVLFSAVAVLVSLALAALLKFKGWQALPVTTSITMLAAIAMLAVWGAGTVARSMRPASGRLLTWLISGLAFIGYEVLVFAFFQNYASDSFVQLGLKCLGLGVLCGVCVALPIWLLVRKGFVVEPVQSGAGIGLVGGLAGSIFLTLHCPVIEAPHAFVWHGAVILVCVGLGAVAGRVVRQSSESIS